MTTDFISFISNEISIDYACLVAVRNCQYRAVYYALHCPKSMQVNWTDSYAYDSPKFAHVNLVSSCLKVDSETS